MCLRSEYRTLCMPSRAFWGSNNSAILLKGVLRPEWKSTQEKEGVNRRGRTCWVHPSFAIHKCLRKIDVSWRRPIEFRRKRWHRKWSRKNPSYEVPTVWESLLPTEKEVYAPAQSVIELPCNTAEPSLNTACGHERRLAYVWYLPPLASCGMYDGRIKL